MNHPISISEIIEQLKANDQAKHVLLSIDLDSRGNFLAKPLSIFSWRGSYCEPALDYELNGVLSETFGDFDAFLQSCPTVSELLQVLEGAIAKDKSFTGYKGGEYTFSGQQLLRCENYGQYKEFTPSISGVIEEEHGEYVILTTVAVEY
jgi:hypothetical protein